MVEWPDIEEGFLEASRRLTADEQQLIKATILELAVNPKGQGTNLHRLDKARDKNLWSCRVTRGIRIILHQQNGRMTLLYVDHHDKAYAWGENRVFKFDDRTKNWKVFKMKEETVVLRTTVAAEPEAKRPYAKYSDDALAATGASPGDFDDIRAATEDSIFNLGLPIVVMEALMDSLSPVAPSRASSESAPTTYHTDAAAAKVVFAEEKIELPTEEVLAAATEALAAPAEPIAPVAPVEPPPPVVYGSVVRVNSQEQLEAVLSGQWEKWQIFLHPNQQELVDAHYAGPVRISGSAGTGKTIVALHRVNHLLRLSDDTRVLLTTLSPALAGFLHARLRKLLADRPRLGERVEVASVDDYAQRLYKLHVGEFNLTPRETIAGWITEACKAAGDAKLRPLFLLNEWEDVIDAQQLTTLEQYQAAERLGRKVRLNAERRQALWAIFAQVWAKLQAAGATTQAGLYHRLVVALEQSPGSPVDHVIVDECQDLNQGQVRFLATLGRGRANALFFTGDIGQRIFQQPFSWKSLGIDLRGRTKTLRVNYRTSQQIRKTADRLLESCIVDADGERVDRSKTISAFGGPAPTISVFDDQAEEQAAVVTFLQERLESDVKPHEMAIMVRDDAQLPRAQAIAQALGIPAVVLDQRLATLVGSLNLSTMHLAKGLEYRAVAVIACDDDVIPSPARLAAISDPGDLKEAYELERHLLYVACTRARDHLFVSGVHPASEFLTDLK
jgi:mRNA-degrading endonuclease RelE of RelBE toxin-antitoxin system